MWYLHFALSHDLQDGCDCLVGSDDNGRLLLNKIFVQDHETEIYAQPELKGHIPKIAQRYIPANSEEAEVQAASRPLEIRYKFESLTTRSVTILQPWL